MPDPSALPHPTLQGGVGGVAGQPGRRCHTLKDHHEQNAARKLPGSFSRTVAAIRLRCGRNKEILGGKFRQGPVRPRPRSAARPPLCIIPQS